MSAAPDGVLRLAGAASMAAGVLLLFLARP
jgi:uncharacterized protein YjeT (DUF2065 family)